MSAVPKLRFSEFSGYWNENRFSKMFQVGSGRDYKHLGTGKVPVFGTGGLIAHVDEFLYDGVSVGIGRKGTIDKPTLMTGKFWTVDTLFYTHSFSGVIPEFLYAIFLRINWKKHNEASGVPSLSKTNIESLKERFPSLPEQKKIADFLGAVDDKIAGLRERERLLTQYKKGVMQKIFTQTLRFKADDGSDFPDWEERKFGEVFQRVTRKNTDNDQNVLTISAQHGLINQRKYFNKSVSAKDVTGYYRIKRGEFAYNKSYSKGYPMGALKRLTRYDSGVVSTLYICFVSLAQTCEEFYEQYFEGGLLNRELHKIAQEGARNHGLLNLSVVEFFRDMSILYPHPDEQQKIADFLSAIDDKTTAVSTQITQMQDFKKGLLQQMFV